jgi:hypothetical protein
VRCFASIESQSIERLSSLKIIVLHFLILKSGNDRLARRWGTNPGAIAPKNAVPAALVWPNLK